MTKNLQISSLQCKVYAIHNTLNPTLVIHIPLFKCFYQWELILRRLLCVGSTNTDPLLKFGQLHSLLSHYKYCSLWIYRPDLWWFIMNRELILYASIIVYLSGADLSIPHFHCSTFCTKLVFCQTLLTNSHRHCLQVMRCCLREGFAEKQFFKSDSTVWARSLRMFCVVNAK